MTFDHRGHTFRLRTERDECISEPWKEFDGHGIVSEWTSRSKSPGERVLVADRNRYIYYDVAESLKIAKRDKWGTADGQREGESVRAYRARAVEADFEFCRGWATDEWCYVSVGVTLLDDDGDETDETEWLGGVESNSEAYIEEIGRELADEILSRVEVDEPNAVLSEN
jgi:hypothetical protein